jgi:hypothetical protein
LHDDDEKYKPRTVIAVHHHLEWTFGVETYSKLNNKNESGMLNPKQKVQTKKRFCTILSHGRSLYFIAAVTGIAERNKNQAPAARIRGRKGFVPTKPYLKWCSETIRKPHAYRIIAPAVTPFDKESTNRGKLVTNF